MVLFETENDKKNMIEDIFGMGNEYSKGFNDGYKKGLMSMDNKEIFYRFPDMSTGKDLDLSKQFEKIEEELDEARRAYYDNDGNEHAILEMMDVLHAVETWFRIEGMRSKELRLYRDVIVSKNKKRGYYNDLKEEGKNAEA